MTSPDASETTLKSVCETFYRHKRKAVLFFVAIVSGVVIFTLLSAKQYRSEGKLFVRLGRENATLDPTATLGQSAIVAVPQSRENEINSVVEILQSRVLLEKVVDALGPTVILASNNPSNSPDPSASKSHPEGWIQQAGAQISQVFIQGKSLLSQFSSSAGLDDHERAILLLAKNVKVDAAKKSNVIQIVYEGPTPELCRSVVAKLIDSYLDEHLRLNRAHGSQEFFTGQTQRLREELSHREIELRDLKNKTGLTSPGAQRQMIVARMGRLEDESLQVEAGKAVAEAKVRELRKKLTSLPETQVTNETSGFGNEGTDLMREQFYALQVRKEARAKYTDNHPKMQQIQEQIAAARAVLNEEERGRKQVTKEPGRLYHQAQLELLSEEPRLASLQAHAHQLQTQLTAVRKELTALNENEMSLATVQRDVDLIEADYRKYSTNLEQAKIDQQLEIQRMSNISIVQPASLEPRPVHPRKMLNLLLGLCAGLFGGLTLPLVLDKFDRSFRTSESIEKNQELPTLASVPRLNPQQLVVNGTN